MSLTSSHSHAAAAFFSAPPQEGDHYASELYSLNRQGPSRSAAAAAAASGDKKRSALSILCKDGVGELWKDLTPPFRQEVPNTSHNDNDNNDNDELDGTCPLAESDVSHNNKTVIHFCFLVHGLKGTSKDLAYLKAAMEADIAAQQQQQQQQRQRQQGQGLQQEEWSNQRQAQEFVIHAIASNEGRTTDGIIHGGERVLQEMLTVLRREMNTRNKRKKSGAEQEENKNQSDNNNNDNDENAVDATISMVGNSLGGLYARYAVARLVEMSSVESSSSSWFSSDSMGQNKTERENDNDSFHYDDNDDDKNKNNLWEAILTLKEQQTRSPSSSFSLRYRLGVYCSTTAPHLGLSKNSYIPLPRSVEVGLGTLLNVASVRDALLLTPLVQDMALEERFLQPLQYFSHRLAYINAYATDFMVPASTAGFLHPRSDYPHFMEQSDHDNDNGDEWRKRNAHGLIVAQMTTPAETTTSNTRRNTRRRTTMTGTSSSSSSSSSFHNSNNNNMADNDNDNDNNNDNVLLQMSRSLDALGWTKIFVDLRKVIPLNLPIWFGTQRPCGEEERMWTSQQVYRAFSAPPNVWWAPPVGHNLIAAVSRSPFAAFWNREGRPIMDQLAMDLVNRLSQLDVVVVDVVEQDEEENNNDNDNDDDDDDDGEEEEEEGGMD